jgi:dihydroflavonol-4-reductase
MSTRVGFAPPIDPVSVEMAQCFWYLDASKAERELGWCAREPSETLLATVEDLRTRGVVWPAS